ncbi:sensor domain-containing protein [Streptomyces sp. NPDC091272]|uniref:sensor domain-containing protein n=1 Tax=Streptomyces sp. NPDC091272 TaxID=3365981 RepID=UPI00382C96B6
MDTLTTQSTVPAPHGRRFPGPREILREPFLAETWRRMLFLLLALPVGLLCVPPALVGRPVGRLQLTLHRRLLGKEFEVRERAEVLGAVHALAALPVHLVALVVTYFCWFVVVINLGYPLRPDNDPTDSWGGPTMAGAWALHGVVGGLGFLLLAPWVARGFTTLQTRLAASLLGRDRRGAGGALALALGSAAVCGLLAVPIVHQL